MMNRLILVVIFWLPLSTPQALAQGVTTAGVMGRVLGPEEEPVADARMELRRDETGVVYTTSTDAAGRFNFTNLRPGGPYTLTASRIGLQTISRGELTLSIGQRMTIDIRLSETAVPLPELSIRVQTDPEFDLSRMGPVTVVDQLSLERLPTISNDFTEFAQLSPLVTVDEGGVSVGGSNVRFNNIQIDGALNQDVFGLSPSGVAGGRARGRVIPLVAIEELQVLVAPYDVRQSGFTGGVLNAVTRSGTNDFKSSVFGFFRDEALVGDPLIGGVTRTPGEISNQFVGFEAGGPIMRDRIHFFAAGELESRQSPPDGFLVGVDDPVLTQLVPDSVARLSNILRSYGVDPGEAGSYTLENDLANLFTRFDLQIDETNSAMFRYNFAGAKDDPAPNRLPGDAYELSSNGTHIESRNHSFLAQWLSTLSPTLSNDLLVSTQFLRDRETPTSLFPRIEVDMSGEYEGTGFLRALRAGSNFFSSESSLDQNILQISNALTIATGKHNLTIGAAFERFSIRRSHLPGSLGTYRFKSLADLEANTPSQYDIRLPIGGNLPETRFAVNQFSAFVQEEARFGDILNVQLGVRVDVPTMPDAPTENSDVEQTFGLRTNQLPTGDPVFSPRIGFNLQAGESLKTQFRGGAGLFTGRPPFAWLAEAYQNTGLSSAFLTCRRRNIGVPDPEVVPIFNPNAAVPVACANGSGTASATPIVTVFDSDFRFPQNFKASLAVDQQLPGGLLLSLEGIYTKAIKHIYLRDVNIGSAIHPSDRTPENGYSDGYGFGDRASFGDGGRGNELIDPPPGAPPGEREPTFFPRRVNDAYGPVIQIGNRSENFAYALSARVRKRFEDWLAVDVGYAFNRSGDIQSLFSLDAASNFGFNAIEGDPNEPKRQPSLFDRPHKFVASITATLPDRLGGTRMSVLYIGQSGKPYSYVYSSDVNADSYPGTGQALDFANDLIYVPESLFDFPGGRSPVSGFLFEQLVGQEPCLQQNRLRILSRNACRTPWSHQIDLRITQGFHVGRVNIDVMLDILNVLNLINQEWGQIHTVNPAVQLMRVDGRLEDDAEPGSVFPEVDDPLEARFVGPLARGENGSVRSILPYLPEIGSSQWQAQFGVRLRFK